MFNIAEIRKSPGSILAVGSYRPGYQAILDFDKLSGKSAPSIVGIVAGGKRFEKFFWGEEEVLVPCYATIQDAKMVLPHVDWLLNITSARRAASVTKEFFDVYPNALGGHLFAEDISEIDAIRLYEQYAKKGKTIAGPAGVGLLVGGALKLGVVGGVDWQQLKSNHLEQQGSVAVLSASGGMINELITLVAHTKHALSFALCFGGDRFPLVTPREAFLAAEADPNTEHIVYYGELGGTDEYEVVSLLEQGLLTKPVVAYIAGVIGENFDQPVQFGHAKALSNSKDETASAKRKALESAGVRVAHSMKQLAELIASIPSKEMQSTEYDFSQRNTSLFTSTISGESSEGYSFVGKPLQEWVSDGNIAKQIISGLLGHVPRSSVTVDLMRDIFLLSVDHGPQVSGALNTIITARAGKGVVDSLAAGLMAIGPRFGGAVSDAASCWFEGVQSKQAPQETVEKYAGMKTPIAGIGHKKYRLDLPDPRTEILSRYAQNIDHHDYYDFAKGIEAITTQKQGNLILNVDGHIAALMLDALASEEGYSPAQIKTLIEADFFNALFIIPRTVGFVSHSLDQKRLDEGLFRLPDEDVLLV